MVESVTFPNGNTYSDGTSGTGHLANDGHRANFIPLIRDVIIVSDQAVDAAAAAAISESAAAASAASAAGSAAGVVLTTTSTSSVLIGTGTKTFTLATAINIQIGQWMKVTDQASSSNYVYGDVTAWNSGTRVVSINVTNTGGSGTKASWYASVAGSPGAIGPSGAGSGDMLAAQNLNDLANKTTSRANLGVAIGTDVQAYDADTSKTDVAETRTAAINMNDQQFSAPRLKDYSEVLVDKGTTSGAISVDYSAGNYQFLTLNGNMSSLTITNPPATGFVGTLSLEINQDGVGGRTIALTSAYKTPGGVPVALTTTASAKDILRLETRDGGTTWRTYLNADIK